jgi:hypothetical protein
MGHTARATVISSLLAAALAIALAAGLAACAGAAGTAQDAAAARTSASAQAPVSANVRGPAAAPGSTAAAGAGTHAVPAEARRIPCPIRGYAAGLLNLPGLSGQAIPPGFSPVAVVQCVRIGAIAPAQQWNSMRAEAAVTGLGPLLTALREPSERRTTAGTMPACLVPATAVPELALIGRDGQVIYPRIPVTACGVPIHQVVASLSALHWIKVATIVEPQSAVTAGTGALAGS